MKTFVLASHNGNKLKEFLAIPNSPHKLLSLNSLPKTIEWEETGDTFEANALIKAKSVKKHTDLPVLGEDSGLVVEDLKGEPGVYSKRYAGPGCTDRDNIEKLLSELERVGSKERKAYFITSLVLMDENEKFHSYTGKCHGTILRKPRGKDGFGYDPVFLPDGYDKSFAELPLSLKNTISHKHNAFHQFLKD